MTGAKPCPAALARRRGPQAARQLKKLARMDARYTRAECWECDVPARLVRRVADKRRMQ